MCCMPSNTYLWTCTCIGFFECCTLWYKNVCVFWIPLCDLQSQIGHVMHFLKRERLLITRQLSIKFLCPLCQEQCQVCLRCVMLLFSNNSKRYYRHISPPSSLSLSLSQHQLFSFSIIFFVYIIFNVYFLFNCWWIFFFLCDCFFNLILFNLYFCSFWTKNYGKGWENKMK